VELFDEELGEEFVSAGIATYQPVEPAVSPEEQMRRVTRSASPIVAESKFLLALGGDHSITAPLVKVCAAKYGYISVLQIDAHADLRNCHQVSRYSHACVMRRVLETTSRICQVGIRSYFKVEYESCPQLAKRFITPAIINTDRKWITHALKLLGDKVYVTIDMDALDPALPPSSGPARQGLHRVRPRPLTRA
jgi:agmatinase